MTVLLKVGQRLFVLGLLLSLLACTVVIGDGDPVNLGLSEDRVAEVQADRVEYRAIVNSIDSITVSTAYLENNGYIDRGRTTVCFFITEYRHARASIPVRLCTSWYRWETRRRTDLWQFEPVRDYRRVQTFSDVGGYVPYR